MNIEHTHFTYKITFKLLVKLFKSILTKQKITIILSYRVSHIKLDLVNGSKIRFGGQIRKFKKDESF